MQRISTGPIYVLRLMLCGGGLLLTPPAVAEAAEPASATSPHELAQATFDAEVLEILENRCAYCHSAEEPTSELNLSSFSGVLAGAASGMIITPGNPDASLLVRVLAAKAEPHMPPDEQLEEEAITAIRRWIEKLPPELAETLGYQLSEEDRQHWSFQPVTRPAIPQVMGEHAAWVRNPVDHFLAAKQAEQGLTPSPPADKLTLIRRATLDLTGLLPTEDEVQRFLADDSPEAFERVVDRLLDSPRYGERWGRHWLDLARYADSGGFEFDYDRPEAFRYRDWVIRGMNEDLPYDQFIMHQLAGDELAPGRRDPLIATGFCRNGPTVGNQENEKNRLDELDDVVGTTSAVFLGLTVSCARCHDHKFEPISQQDYYEMLSIFDPLQKVDAENVMAVIDSTPRPKPTHLMLRGDHRSPGIEVQPAVPDVLVDAPVEFPTPGESDNTTYRRATLARWIANADNPLTARVMVNRIWLYHFGQGLVSTPSNFGRSGESPSHPELLDWLAAEFVSGGWHMKRMHKLLMTSAAYQQQSIVDPQRQTLDPTNTFVWRFPKRRLEAEVLRDAMLQASGNLNLEMFGPGVKPRIDPGIIATGSTAKWPIVEKEGPEHWRRSVYIFVKRSVLMPMMEGFDAPTATQSCEQRMITTVPTQALQLMNNEFGNEQADYMAQRLLKECGESLPVQIEQVYWLTLSRPPQPAELQMATEFLHQQQYFHQAQLTNVAVNQVQIPLERCSAEAKQRALADLCHVMFNLNEFAYLP